jgi:hypothetical protein
MSAPSPSLRVHAAMAEIPKDAWDALAVPLETPFLEWDFLHLLEESGSAAPDEGWLPRHLTVWDGRELVAAAPMYLKTTSRGEFVFDHVWAEVAERLGLAYFPKLVGMSPFTPTGHYRFLLPSDRPDDVSQVVLTDLLVAGTESLVRQWEFSGSHFHYLDPDLAQTLGERGYSLWQHQSFVWENLGYACFDDFLAAFTRNQRRNIIKERRALAREGVRVEVLEGEAITESLMACMYDYYVATNAKFGPWGCKFLSRDFFLRLPERFGHRLALVVARAEGLADPVGMALLVHKGSGLYGRYWGGMDIRFLHFEVCYYTPIQWAIERGLRFFDPGIGGEHKVRRGFTAVSNVSAHRFADPRLRAVMESHMADINAYTLAEIEAVNDERPLVSVASPQA